MVIELVLTTRPRDLFFHKDEEPVYTHPEADSSDFLIARRLHGGAKEFVERILRGERSVHSDDDPFSFRESCSGWIAFGVRAFQGGATVVPEDLEAHGSMFENLLRTFAEILGDAAIPPTPDGWIELRRICIEMGMELGQTGRSW
jgi:hypothetical protein